MPPVILLTGAGASGDNSTAVMGNGLVSLSFKKSIIVGGALNGEMYHLNITIIQPSQGSQLPTSQQPFISWISPMAATASSNQQGFYTTLWGI